MFYLLHRYVTDAFILDAVLFVCICLAEGALYIFNSAYSKPETIFSLPSVVVSL
jgi:hypothetical protein